MWELVILFGITWAGTGGQRTAVVESKQECLQILEATRVNVNGNYATAQDTDVVIAFCRPYKGE